jgi:hypothetical protein
MKRIEKLAERLRKLRVRNDSAKLIEVLSSHENDVAKSLETFEAVWSGIEASKAVFGEGRAREALAPCAPAFSGASRAAKRVVEEIREHPERTHERRVGDGVSDIKAYAKEAQKCIAGFWNMAIDGRCELARATAAVASLAGSNTASDIEKRIKRVRAIGIPTSRDSVRQLVAELDALERDIARAGVPERVRLFMQSAWSGSASPKELEDEEIRRFLDRNALWARITVRLT